MMPTLTQIRDYDVSHLVEPVPGLTEVSDNWPYHSAAALRDLIAQEWTGVNGPATIAALTRTSAMATALAAPVAAVAALAPSAATAGLAHQSRAMAIVGWCLEGAYWVGDDLTVTDMLRSPNAAVYKARSQIGDWLHDLLTDAARAMGAHDAAVAQAIDGHHATMVDYVTHPDGTATYTPGHHAPALINEHGGKTPVAPDPRDHHATGREIIDAFGKVATGIGIEEGGVIAAPATGGGSLIGSIPGGAKEAYDGLDDLAHMTNMGRLPAAPPVIGQDGPG